MTQPLPFGSQYPESRQGTNFAQRFLVHALRCGVAYRFGGDAMTILTAVVTTEGRRWYRGPVRFWRDHLLSIVGLNRNRLLKLTKELVQHGWLHYEPGAKGRASVYWVTVPGGDEEINDSALGETDQDGEILHSNRDRIRDRKRAECGTASVTHSRDIPEPKNPPPSGDLPGREEEEIRRGRRRPGRKGRVLLQNGSVALATVSNRPGEDQRSAEYLAVVAQAKACGVSLAEETISKAICLGASIEHLSAVLAYAADQPRYQHPQRGTVCPWGGGAVWKRLDSPSLLMQPPNQGWARPDPDWQTLHRKALESAARERERLREHSQKAALEDLSKADREQLKQLEFQFGEQLQQLSTDSLLELLTKHGTAAVDGVLPSYYIARVRKSGATGFIRKDALKAFAAKVGMN